MPLPRCSAPAYRPPGTARPFWFTGNPPRAANLPAVNTERPNISRREFLCGAAAGMAGVALPAGLTASVAGEAPGFVDPEAGDFHLRANSLCRGAGVSDPRSRDATGSLVRTLPTHESRRRRPGATERRNVGKLDIGAFEYVP
jgi:hypothetical protein